MDINSGQQQVEGQVVHCSAAAAKDAQNGPKDGQ
eukprot:CAMPEP_0174374284 /NCGR_PEP_ID=MMETSP0811_2-20130205/110336_1 /TAXON_ID=73025 ORGANISM="Eutreptiella gymnastica-like, Strain CCMP1594" /NCGR_SAMPLE_ID=MMETSP0811_2 /ASSEMBLY_ACC=CAM_ASM_000667 /LENGTH=33 /DNA_ID= /DNA_START= /DNA_END= /DNA_ORIENTATION=